MATISEERKSPADRWTLNGKLFDNMSDYEVEREAEHWAAEVRFYNRVNSEFNTGYQQHETMRYRNYIASKENWRRKHKDVLIIPKIINRLIEHGGDGAGQIPLQTVFDILKEIENGPQEG